MWASARDQVEDHSNHDDEDDGGGNHAAYQDRSDVGGTAPAKSPNVVGRHVRPFVEPLPNCGAGATDADITPPRVIFYEILVPPMAAVCTDPFGGPLAKPCNNEQLALNVGWTCAAEVGSHRGQCGKGIMLAWRLAMIQTDPVMTRKTISMPKASATILLV